MRLSHDQKEQALAGMRLLGTKKAGALAANIPIEKLNEEIKKSAVFKKRVNEALANGKTDLGDNALSEIHNIAFNNNDPKALKHKLLALLAIANWSVPGFKGATTVQGKIDHDVRVITAVPRPNYEVLDNTPKKMLQSGKRTKKIEILDDKGEYIGTQTVEEAIEGEVINEGN
jgi:hypothetical protein